MLRSGRGSRAERKGDMYKKKKKPKANKTSRKVVKPEKKAGGKKPKSGEDYPHFRHYKKSNHPALITGERPEDEYNYRKVTHAERDGRHRNEKVVPNPNQADAKPMYIVKRVRSDKKMNFSKWKYPWKYPPKK